MRDSTLNALEGLAAVRATRGFEEVLQYVDANFLELRSSHITQNALRRIFHQASGENAVILLKWLGTHTVDNGFLPIVIKTARELLQPSRLRETDIMEAARHGIAICEATNATTDLLFSSYSISQVLNDVLTLTSFISDKNPSAAISINKKILALAERYHFYTSPYTSYGPESTTVVGGGRWRLRGRKLLKWRAQRALNRLEGKAGLFRRAVQATIMRVTRPFIIRPRIRKALRTIARGKEEGGPE